MFDDGVYGLSFAPGHDGTGCPAAEDRGEGLVILRRGEIFGSDPHGGLLQGACHFNPDRAEAEVKLQLAIPPFGVLLTGLEAGPDGKVIEVAGRFSAPRPVSSAVVDVGGLPVVVELRYVGPLQT